MARLVGALLLMAFVAASAAAYPLLTRHIFNALADGRAAEIIWVAPPVIFVIPYFILMTKIGWSGTYQSMIVILQTITVPFSIWLLKSFIDETPYELEESAMIDGASRFQAFGVWE